MAKDDKQIDMDQEAPRLGLGGRLAIGGVVAAGALVSGLLVSRRGRRLVADTFRGRQPSPLADQVLDRLWDDAVLGRRRLDVNELPGGVVELTGSVASDRERSIAVTRAAAVAGVMEVRDHVVIDPTIKRRKVRRLRPREPAAGE